MSNPIIVHDQPAPDLVADPPKRHIYRMRDLFFMPRGIEMKEYVHGNGSILFLGQYINKKDAQPTNRPKRVYKIELTYRPYITFGRYEPPAVEFKGKKIWTAKVFEEETTIVSLSGDSKWTVAAAALGALRGILHARCAHTGGNRRRRRKAAANNSVNPVNPVENKEVA